MTVAAKMLRSAFRLVSNCSLLAALLLILVWRASYTCPVSISRSYPLGPVNWAGGEHLIASFRGGLWSLHLEYRPRDPLWPPPPPARQSRWRVDAPADFDWERRLQDDIIGRRNVFGVHNNTLRREQAWRTNDGVSPGPRELVIVEEHRTLRLPYGLIFAGLVTLPALRAALTLWQRRRQDPIRRTSLPVYLARGGIEVLVTSSLLAFLAAVWGCAASLRGNVLAAVGDHWQSQRIAPGFGMFVSIPCYEERTLEITRDGWELAHAARDDGSGATGGGRRGYGSSGLLILDTNTPRLARLDDFGSRSSHLAGFAFARTTLPPGTPPTLTWPPPPGPPPPPPPPPSTTAPRLLLPGPRLAPPRIVPPTPTPPIVGWAVRIPHWAMLLATAALPAGWLAVRLRRDRASRRRVAGQCPECGYDCRATPERCPECGSILRPAARGEGVS